MIVGKVHSIYHIAKGTTYIIERGRKGCKRQESEKEGIEEKGVRG